MYHHQSYLDHAAYSWDSRIPRVREHLSGANMHIREEWPHTLLLWHGHSLERLFEWSETLGCYVGCWLLLFLLSIIDLLPRFSCAPASAAFWRSGYDSDSPHCLVHAMSGFDTY